MLPTILDIKTGETHVITDEMWDNDFYWWSEGNGSCDCNRAIAIGEDTDGNYCLGNTRYLIVDVSGNLEGMSKPEILVEINYDYPMECDKHIETAVQKVLLEAK